MANERDSSNLSSGDSPRSVSSVSELPAPGKVDKKDLQEGGWLLNRQQREMARKNLDQKEQYRRGEQGPIFAKGERGYAVMRATGPDGKVRDYAIYKGKGENERNHALGQGNYGRVKLSQNLEDGSWDVVKIQIVCGINLKEWIDQENKMLNEVGEGKGSVSRKKQLKGERLNNLIKQLRKEGLRNEAFALEQEAKQNQAEGKGYYATVIEVVSVSTFAPGKTLTSVIESNSLGVSSPNYFNIARNIIQSYQSQIQGVDSNGQPLPGRTMSLVHRDIKPDNIIIDDQGNARFVDLGMAHNAKDRSPDSGGTPGYMAPEINDGKSASEKSDVYALGIVLAETFGFVRVDGDGNLQQANQSESRIPDPETREQILKLCQEMTSKDLNQRLDIRTCLERLDAISPQLVQSMNSQSSDQVSSASVSIDSVGTEAQRFQDEYTKITDKIDNYIEKNPVSNMDSAENLSNFKKTLYTLRLELDRLSRNVSDEEFIDDINHAIKYYRDQANGYTQVYKDKLVEGLNALINEKTTNDNSGKIKEKLDEFIVLGDIVDQGGIDSIKEAERNSFMTVFAAAETNFFIAKMVFSNLKSFNDSSDLVDERLVFNIINSYEGIERQELLDALGEFNNEVKERIVELINYSEKEDVVDINLFNNKVSFVALRNEINNLLKDPTEENLRSGEEKLKELRVLGESVTKPEYRKSIENAVDVYTSLYQMHRTQIQKQASQVSENNNSQESSASSTNSSTRSASSTTSSEVSDIQSVGSGTQTPRELQEELRLLLEKSTAKENFAECLAAIESIKSPYLKDAFKESLTAMENRGFDFQHGNDVRQFVDLVNQSFEKNHSLKVQGCGGILDNIKDDGAKTFLSLMVAEASKKEPALGAAQASSKTEPVLKQSQERETPHKP